MNRKAFAGGFERALAASLISPEMLLEIHAPKI